MPRLSAQARPPDRHGPSAIDPDQARGDTPQKVERRGGQAILATGVEVSLSTPAEFGKLMQSEGQKWGKVVREVGAKVD